MENSNFLVDICGVRFSWDKLNRFYIPDTFTNVEMTIDVKKEEELLGKKIYKAFRASPDTSYIVILDSNENILYEFGQFEAVSYEFHIVPTVGLTERVSIALKQEIN